MIRVDPFAPEDLAALTAQLAQAELPHDVVAHGRGLADRGPCFTIRPAIDARPVFCGGAIVTHAGLATLWSVLSDDAGPHLTAITRRTRWFIARLDHRRVDTMIRVGFAPAKRWAEMLGFRAEAMMADYFENGDDAMMYRLQR